MSTPAKWIDFHECVPRTPAAKTKRWAVSAKEGAGLGTVQWFGRWRQYTFFPAPATAFEPVCLRDIATFCEEQTRAHLLARKSEGLR